MLRRQTQIRQPHQGGTRKLAIHYGFLIRKHSRNRPRVQAPYGHSIKGLGMKDRPANRDVVHTVTNSPNASINHSLHFVLTLLSGGAWGLVWWWLITNSEDSQGFFSSFDDDYWSYLIEREQPPAALYRQRFSSHQSNNSDKSEFSAGGQCGSLSTSSSIFEA